MTDPLRWELHADVLAGLALAGGAYLLGVGPLRRRLGGPDRFPWGRGLAFSGALGTILVALNGPLHDLSERWLVSAHMAQHLLLGLVMPALLLAGLPGWLLRPWLQRPRGEGVGRRLTRPLPALSLYAVVLALWHLPALYQWALRHHEGHVLQHLMFMAAGVLLWWPVLSPLPKWQRLPPPGQLLYLFLAGIPMVPVGAFLTLSDEVLYPWYGDGPLRWGLMPLADQRLGGIVMWVGGPLILLVALTIVFFRWMGGGAERAVAAPAEGGAHGTA